MESPLYFAVIGCCPAFVNFTFNVATAVASKVTVPRRVRRSKKVTVPVGVLGRGGLGRPGPGTTTATNLTVWPTAEGLGFVLSLTASGNPVTNVVAFALEGK